MYREIKFRGQNTEGVMVYGSLVNTTLGIKHMPKQHTKTWIVESAFGDGVWFNILKRQYVKPETVGEFAERKDKNGVEIYEGDIVKAHIQNMDFEAVVKFGKGSWSLKCDRRNREKWGTIKYYKLPHSDNIEVIGNIHE